MTDAPCGASSPQLAKSQGRGGRPADTAPISLRECTPALAATRRSRARAATGTGTGEKDCAGAVGAHARARGREFRAIRLIGGFC